MEQAISKKVFTIPNLLSMFRVLLVGVFGYVYWTAKSQSDYNVAIGVLVVSGLTDFLDGKIARKFNMISEVGKILDPIADKLTQAMVACCLALHYGPMKLLFLVLFIKEWIQGIYGMRAVKKAGYNDGALLCGKITTFYLYVMMGLLLLWKGIPMPLAYVLIFIGVGLLLWSFVSYLMLFRGMLKGAKENGIIGPGLP